MAGVKTEEEFYKKFPDENSFFKSYPQAANGYTFQEPDTNILPQGSVPVQMQPNAQGNDFIQYQPSNLNVNQTQPQGQSQGSSFNTTGAIQQGVGIATDVIDTIGRINRGIQIAAPQILNALIPEQHSERTRTPQVGYNQYAYGTGSQAMYANGGDVFSPTPTSITPLEAQTRQQIGIPYQVSDVVRNQPLNPLYPQSSQTPASTQFNLFNPRAVNWQDSPMSTQTQSQGSVPLKIQQFIYDEQGRNTGQLQDKETLYFNTVKEKDDYLKQRKQEQGYGLWFNGDLTRGTAVDTRAGNPKYMEMGGDMDCEVGETYEMTPAQLRRLREQGYEFEIK